MTDFHRSLDRALHHEDDNTLAIGTFCETCGTRLVGGERGDKHPCPFGPHEAEVPC